MEAPSETLQLDFIQQALAGLQLADLHEVGGAGSQAPAKQLEIELWIT